MLSAAEHYISMAKPVQCTSVSDCDLIKFSIVSPRQWDASLETHEKLYSDSVNLFPSSHNTIKLGMTLTRALKRAFRSTEAKRLVPELF